MRSECLRLQLGPRTDTSARCQAKPIFRRPSSIPRYRGIGHTSSTPDCIIASKPRVFLMSDSQSADSDSRSGDALAYASTRRERRPFRAACRNGQVVRNQRIAYIFKDASVIWDRFP